MAEITRPNFICFTTEMKEKDGEGRMSLIARVEEMDLTNEEIIAVKTIQEQAATELRKLLMQ